MSEIVSANNNLITTSNVQIIDTTPDAITNVDAFPPNATVAPERTNQQKMLPTSVQTRLLGKLFSNNPSSNALGSGIYNSINLPTASSASFLFTVADNAGREVIAVPYVAFYIFDTTSNSYLHWPNPSFGMGNMPTSVFNDWGNDNQFNTVTRAVIRNNTGSTQLVQAVCRFRIITVITNQGGSTSQVS